MNRFYGKAYRYKNKIVGVHSLGTTRMYMIGQYDPKTGETGMSLPLFGSAEKAQKELDDFAAARGLAEDRHD